LAWRSAAAGKGVDATFSGWPDRDIVSDNPFDDVGGDLGGDECPGRAGIQSVAYS